MAAGSAARATKGATWTLWFAAPELQADRRIELVDLVTKRFGNRTSRSSSRSTTGLDCQDEFSHRKIERELCGCAGLREFSASLVAVDPRNPIECDSELFAPGFWIR